MNIRLESAILAITVLVPGAITVLDTIGLMEVLSDDTTDMIILVVVSAHIILLITQFSRRSDDLQQLRKSIRFLAEKDEISQERLESIVLGTSDQKLRPMFEQHLRPMIRDIVLAYERQTVDIPKDSFTSYYMAVLDAFPRSATLVATSLPLRRYFWDTPIENKLKDFIKKRGGKVQTDLLCAERPRGSA